MALITTFIPHEPNTWPHDLLLCFDEGQETLIERKKLKNNDYDKIMVSNEKLDLLISEIGKIASKYSLIGYHCTKLIPQEIEDIYKNGLQLLSYDFLCNRIEKITELGIIDKEIGKLLQNENEAKEEYRANHIWFTFFRPKIAGMHGISRFFKYWGGEALYNTHEHNGTGQLLQRIGIPCVVEAQIPIEYIEVSSFSLHLLDIYKGEHGISAKNLREFEGYSRNPIPPKLILNVFQFPSAEFVELTGCEVWRDKIVI